MIMLQKVSQEQLFLLNYKMKAKLLLMIIQLLAIQFFMEQLQVNYLPLVKLERDLRLETLEPQQSLKAVEPMDANI